MAISCHIDRTDLQYPTVCRPEKAIGSLETFTERIGLLGHLPTMNMSYSRPIRMLLCRTQLRLDSSDRDRSLRPTLSARETLDLDWHLLHGTTSIVDLTEQALTSGWCQNEPSDYRPRSGPLIAQISKKLPRFIEKELDKNLAIMPGGFHLTIPAIVLLVHPCAVLAKTAYLTRASSRAGPIAFARSSGSRKAHQPLTRANKRAVGDSFSGVNVAIS